MMWDKQGWKWAHRHVGVDAARESVEQRALAGAAGAMMAWNPLEPLLLVPEGKHVQVARHVSTAGLPSSSVLSEFTRSRMGVSSFTTCHWYA